MRILFIYVDIRKEEGCIGKTMQGSYKDLGGMFYMGLAHISAVLKAKGHETKLVFITDMDGALPKIHETIENWNPNMVAYSATVTMFPYVSEISKEIRNEYPNMPQVIGGAHATVSPEEVLNNSAIDYLVVGEGEYPLLELCEGKDKKAIKNLAYLEGGTLKSNPLRRLIDLDTLPFPDWGLFDYLNCYDGNLKRLNVVVSRGCPYKCAYCNNHAIASIYKGLGRYDRFPSPAKAIGILKSGLEQYPELEYVDFRDDDLLLHQKWFEEFSLKYYDEVGLPSVCIARVDQINERNAVLLKEYMKCKMIRVGVESGNEYIRKLCKRNMSNEKIIKAFKILQKYNIKTYAYYMIGLPYETPEMFRDTIKLHAQLGVDVYHLSVFYPFKRTQLYDICEMEGWITDKKIPDYFHETILDQPSISNDEIKYFIDNFDALAEKEGGSKE